MSTGQEWSRSRFWLCHFLHNRHVRPKLKWTGEILLDATLRRELRAWLARGAGVPAVPSATFVRGAGHRYASDPAFVQSLRLMAKEQQHHVELLVRLSEQLGATRREASRWRNAVAELLHLPGARFELSVMMLSDLLDAEFYRLLNRATSDATISAAAESVHRDKLAHAAFHCERLTMELADLNFARRNLRRLRMRGMFVAALTLTLLHRGRLIRAAGSSRVAFAKATWRHFRGVLESVVPYRREALLAALLSQREKPYAKSQYADVSTAR